MEHDLNILMIFCHKRKINNFDPYNVFLAIATNIPQQLMTGFVHVWSHALTAFSLSKAVFPVIMTSS